MNGKQDTVGFKRARSEAQREQRRRVILDTAAVMLAEMPVAELSLNELSRRVGLAKSNVLRYFETREAVLLELLDGQLREWAAELGRVPTLPHGSPRARGDHLAEAMAGGLATRPMLCDLISAQAGVLERNVSTEIVLRHKRATLSTVNELSDIVRRHVPELQRDAVLTIISFTLLMSSAAWPHNRPTAAVLGAYEADADIAAMHMEFAATIRQMIELSIAGLLARQST
jgi:AcrR family transcriptional regulator